MPNNFIYPLKWAPLKNRTKKGQGRTNYPFLGFRSRNTHITFFLLVRQKGQLFLLPTKTISHATRFRREKGSFDSFALSAKSTFLKTKNTMEKIPFESLAAHYRVSANLAYPSLPFASSIKKTRLTWLAPLLVPICRLIVVWSKGLSVCILGS